MMDAQTRDDTSLFSDDRVRLAAGNYEAQEWLFREIHKAYRMSDATIEDVAHELDLTPEEAQDWIDGEVDLTLTELRQLANAVDAKIKYQVQAMRTLYVDRLQSIHSGPGWSSPNLWGDARIER